MISELLQMQLASDQQKKQTHDSPHFPCSAYYTDWNLHKIEGVPWHWHKELEFMTVIRGKAMICFGDQSHLLEAGDGFFCNSSSLHQIHMADCESCCVHSLVFDANLISGGAGTVFDEKYVYPLVSSKAFSGTALFRSSAVHREILRHLTSAHESCRDEAYGYEYDVRYHLAKALLLIVQENQDALSASAPASGQMNRIRKMLEYIHQNYAAPITISDLAASANICERECQRCFRKILHLTPMEYVQQYRIQMAGKLLMETKDSILNVGLAVGFANPSHFCKVFKQYMNCTPAGFRSKI